MLGWSDMSLVDGHDSVDNLGLDGLLVDHWLDCLVHMVMYMFASNTGSNSL